MTTDEIRNWLAEDDGLVDRSAVVGNGEKPWWNTRTGAVQWAHPFPPTLDGAAKALPEGVYWTRNGEGWFTYINNTFTPLATTADTGDEIHDRYRLAMEARKAMKGAANGTR